MISGLRILLWCCTASLGLGRPDLAPPADSGRDRGGEARRPAAAFRLSLARRGPEQSRLRPIRRRRAGAARAGAPDVHDPV